jgi:hypothetical protein
MTKAVPKPLCATSDESVHRENKSSALAGHASTSAVPIVMANQFEKEGIHAGLNRSRPPLPAIT